MTDRQYVKQIYPNAVLDFCTRPVHDYGGRGILAAGRSWYRILSDNILNSPDVIARGKTRTEAWRNAKNIIKNPIRTA